MVRAVKSESPTLPTLSLHPVPTSLDPDSVEQLQSGISRERTIENDGEWAYFMFIVNDPEVDVTISVSPTYVMFLHNHF